MILEAKRQVIAVLLQAQRPDLANAVAATEDGPTHDPKLNQALYTLWGKWNSGKGRSEKQQSVKLGREGVDLQLAKKLARSGYAEIYGEGSDTYVILTDKGVDLMQVSERE